MILLDNNWWRESADDGIKLDLGDRVTKPLKDDGGEIALNDRTPNAMCMGATGAGKSMLINHILSGLITNYPPSALSMVLVDFKDVEFQCFADKSTHLSRIPHASLLAGTKDGSFAIPVLSALTQELEERVELFAKAGVRKIDEYNHRMREMDMDERCLPRILVVFDEFQVPFTDPEKRVVDLIKDYMRRLIKRGRYCGCHLLFCSQSVTSGLPKDILEAFPLRMALRCSEEASIGMIGSPDAAGLDAKYGYLYTNTEAGSTQDTTCLWHTPFADPEGVYGCGMSLLNIMQELVIERGEVDRRASFTGRIV